VDTVRPVWSAVNKHDQVCAPLEEATDHLRPQVAFEPTAKVGREYVEGRTFATRRQAHVWLARERAAVAGGGDRVRGAAGQEPPSCLAGTAAALGVAKTWERRRIGPDWTS
jgi:hypothetical protein